MSKKGCTVQKGPGAEVKEASPVCKQRSSILFPIDPKWFEGPQLNDCLTFKKFPLGIVVKRFKSRHPHIMNVMATGVEVHTHFRRHVTETD